MQNIIDILKELVIEVPEDKTTDLNKKVAENYKTVAEHTRKLEKAEADRDNYKSQLETAQETLKGFEGVDLNTINQQLADYKKKAEDAEKEYSAKIAERDFEDALKAEMENYKFSSGAAKKSVMAQIREKGLKVSNGKILGLSDLIDQIKEEDASAFVDESDPNQNPNPARFTQHMSGSGQKETGKDILAKMTLDERIQLKNSNPTYYQKLIKGD